MSQELKTLSKVSQLPVVEAAVINATYYYNSVKNYNTLLRMSCNVAEYSCQIGIAIAKPVVMYIAKKPITNADEYLSEKIDTIEKNYPVVNKPTNEIISQATTQIESVYSKNLKTPVDKAKEVITNGSKKFIETKTYIEDIYTKNIKAPIVAYMSPSQTA